MSALGLVCSRKTTDSAAQASWLTSCAARAGGRMAWPGAFLEILAERMDREPDFAEDQAGRLGRPGAGI